MVPVICVAVTERLVSAVPPRVTFVMFAKFDPTIVTLVPPSVEPLVGVIDVIVMAGAT